MFKNITTLLLFIAFAQLTFSQQMVRGKVSDENEKPLYGVNVFIPELQTGAQTNFNGLFEIKNIPSSENKIEIHFSYIGYMKVVKEIDLPQKEEVNIILKPDPVQTDEVVITENREGVFLRNSPVKIEVITTKQIEKNYSIDLTQAFQYTPGVKVQNNCGICATTDLRIQGLEGQYSQILINGHPVISNLGTVYGLMGINSSNIKQIEIVKGPGTILYGPEAVSGTINVILKDPSDLPAYSYKFEGTTHLEHAFSVSGVQKWDNTATSLIIDYAGNYNRIDENEDGYTDVPLFNRYSFMNQWISDFNENTSLKIFGRYYYEDRFGGQMNWNRKIHRGGSEVYGESIFTNRGEIFGGLTNKLSDALELQINFSGVYHNQNSFYGNTFYDADQLTNYVDLLAIHKINEQNTITFGSAYKFDRYDDNSSATIRPSKSHIFSLFSQDEFKLNDHITTLFGLRYNYHNIQKGIWQPRASLKISPAPLTALRISFGTGFRTVNLFTEDHAAYTGARDVVIAEALNPERSLNTSVSFIQNFDLLSQFIKFEVSGHYTEFSNQIIPDYDTDVRKIIYKNLNGHSVSRGIETSFSYENFIFPVKAFISYEFLETYKVEEDIRSDIEFNPKHVVNVQLDYLFRNLDMELNLTGKWVGRQKLPEIAEPFARPTISEPYSVWNINLQKKYSGIILSIGISNIFNYTQPTPLIDPQNPFGDYFDTVYIYGPLHGRELTASVQFNFN
jgi:outer membrane receptor for ferrienterochelin and colicins